MMTVSELRIRANRVQLGFCTHLRQLSEADPDFTKLLIDRLPSDTKIVLSRGSYWADVQPGLRALIQFRVADCEQCGVIRK